MPVDVAIVGAGSAGSVLAARLTEDAGRSVVLLEAGPDYPALADMPPEIRSGLRPVFTHDWGYRADTALDGRVVDANRARIVGGCSATNAAFALRGRPEDYNAWDAMGCTGWSFAASPFTSMPTATEPLSAAGTSRKNTRSTEMDT